MTFYGFNMRFNFSVGIGGFLALILIFGCVHAASVDLDNWTFAADLGDQWRYDSQNEETGDIVGWSSTDGEMSLYKGIKKGHAFWLAEEDAVVDLQDFPSAPHPQENGILAIVGIWINKVPEKVRNWTERDILDDYYGPALSGSRKDIEFNDRPALLIENDYDSDVVNDDDKVIRPASSIGQISILMTEDTIVSLDVMITPETNLRAWDIIKKFTISPKKE